MTDQLAYFNICIHTINSCWSNLVNCFRYDPYDKKLTEEFYDHKMMKEARKNAIDLTRNASKVGFILGTLGRQGSISVLDHLRVSYEQLPIFSCSTRKVHIFNFLKP